MCVRAFEWIRTDWQSDFGRVRRPRTGLLDNGHGAERDVRKSSGSTKSGSAWPSKSIEYKLEIKLRNILAGPYGPLCLSHVDFAERSPSSMSRHNGGNCCDFLVVALEGQDWNAISLHFLAFKRKLFSSAHSWTCYSSSSLVWLLIAGMTKYVSSTYLTSSVSGCIGHRVFHFTLTVSLHYLKLCHRQSLKYDLSMTMRVGVPDRRLPATLAWWKDGSTVRTAGYATLWLSWRTLYRRTRSEHSAFTTLYM